MTDKQADALFELAPYAGAALFLLFIVSKLARPGRSEGRWVPASVAAGLFAVWSGYAVYEGGWIGFWPLHQAGAWGNQIWFDLLLAIGAGWTLLLPRARSVGMQVVPWTLLILCTGSIGLCAMLSRCLYLEGSARHGAGGK